MPFYRNGGAKCFDWWEAQGIDIDGYTTMESVHDIEDLRRALGVKTIELWGISYGSHLGLAMHEVLSEVGQQGGAVRHRGSGPDGQAAGADGQAVRPCAGDHRRGSEGQGRLSRSGRHDAARACQAERQSGHGHVHAAGRERTGDGHLRWLRRCRCSVSGSIADPPGFTQIPLLYLAVDNGKYEVVAPRIYNFRQQLTGFSGMSSAMDLASGATKARLALTQKEAETSLLGDTLNFPMPQLLGIRDADRPGDEFRAPFKSDIPALFISGTLDGRTYPDEADRGDQGLLNKRRLIVENGGHNIYEADQRVADAVAGVLQGRDDAGDDHVRAAEDCNAVEVECRLEAASVCAPSEA